VKLLIKLGGTLLDEAASRQAIAQQLAEVSWQHQTVVVHGGGKQVTRYLQERGVESRFVGGLRVSDPTVIEAVTNVIAGSVNKQLVASLISAGVSAVGISGVDGSLTSAEQLRPELGFVGRPVGTSAHLLNLLIGGQYIPVVACIAGDRQGSIFNVNADQMAVSCAAGWGADRLVFLTDVPGVKDSIGNVLPRLTVPEIHELIASGVAHGGMQAKLEAAQTALQAGIAEVTIALGQESNVCARLLANEALGTRLFLTPRENGVAGA
jgi:acetylglutamate kinase